MGTLGCNVAALCFANPAALYETFAILFQFKNLNPESTARSEYWALQLSECLQKATLQTRVAVENSQFKNQVSSLDVGNEMIPQRNESERTNL